VFNFKSDGVNVSASFDKIVLQVKCSCGVKIIFPYKSGSGPLPDKKCPLCNRDIEGAGDILKAFCELIRLSELHKERDAMIST
jgi:hypothetical protein